MHVAKGHVYADGVRVSDPDAALAGAKIELRIRRTGTSTTITPLPGRRPGRRRDASQMRTKAGSPRRPR